MLIVETEKFLELRSFGKETIKRRSQGLNKNVKITTLKRDAEIKN